ncbi:MAG TPA: M23 family metallopeptidase [Gemmatimonadaceae bacterium]|nr:M23 family metallopeptidase [Gemmatimonadaceae bacterium]
MKRSIVRPVTYGVAAALVAATLYFTPPLPQRQPAAEVLGARQQGAPAPALPLFRQTVDTLARGESLRGIFARGGVSDLLANEALKALTLIDPNRVRAGMKVTFRLQQTDSVPSEIVLQLAIDRLLHLQRHGDRWTEQEEQIPWTTDTIVVAGKINSTLYDAMDASAQRVLPAAARQQLTWALADIFEYKVDMSRDLQEGDEFRVLAERASSPTGAVKVGRILAATFTLSGTELQAIRYKSDAVGGDYFDQNGRSLRAAFLRAPLEFRRISSTFGGRWHPILGVWKQHKGTDYAAALGTPVRAIGDGVIIRAGWGNGYGNVLEIRHRNGFVTRYGHLHGFARGIHVGTRVAIGETVAYVGATGLATGPHLHFEVLVDGVQRDPRIALRNSSGDPVPARERAAFDQVRTQMLAALDKAPGPVLGLASR